MKRVLHVMSSIAAEHGEPASAVINWASGLPSFGWSADVAVTYPRGQAPPRPDSDVNVFAFESTDSAASFSPSLARWLRREVSKYDLIHVHGLFQFPTLAAALEARRRGLPYLVSPHGSLNNRGPLSKYASLKRLLLHSTDRFILHGSDCIHFASREEEAEARLTIQVKSSATIPYAVSCNPAPRKLARQRLRELYPQIGDRRSVVLVSVAHAKKDLNVLLDAFKLLRRRHVDAALIVSGSSGSEESGAFEQHVQDLGPGDDIVATGFVTGAAKWDVLAGSDVFCLPSYSESFGIAAVESMACGTPVVTTGNVPVSSTVARYGAGEIVNSFDSEAVAQALEPLLTNPRLWTRASRACLRAVSEQYDSTAACGSMARTYERLACR